MTDNDVATQGAKASNAKVLSQFSPNNPVPAPGLTHLPPGNGSALAHVMACRLSPDPHQAITWTNADLLSVGPLDLQWHHSDVNVIFKVTLPRCCRKSKINGTEEIGLEPPLHTHQWIGTMLGLKLNHVSKRTTGQALLYIYIYCFTYIICVCLDIWVRHIWI